MAKAQFHRNQKVWVETVGTWATVEKFTPVWAKGFEEPVRISSEVGLGREFQAHELSAEEALPAEPDIEGGWRLLRARNKWQAPQDCSHHPYPGTFPVVVTDKTDWGGWRTPGAEYDRDPRKIERQARLIAAAPRLMALARDMVALVAEYSDEAPEPLRELAQRAAAIERQIQDVPNRPAESERTQAEA